MPTSFSARLTNELHPQVESEGLHLRATDDAGDSLVAETFS